MDPTSGVALVTNYTLDVFLAGGSTPQASANLGKPTPEADGMIRVDFVALLSTCAWTVSSGTSWITLGGSRTGSGNATYTVGANSGSTSRTALVTVAGVSVRFNQGAATAPLAPTNLRVVK